MLTRKIDINDPSSFALEGCEWDPSPLSLTYRRKEIRWKFRHWMDDDDDYDVEWFGWGAGITKNIETIKHYLERSKKLAKEDIQ